MPGRAIREGAARIFGGAGRLLARVPGLRVLGRAALNYIHHESANQAGHVAFSTVLAMFPFLLFLATGASFIGEPGAAAELAALVIGFAPQAVAETVTPAIDEVLRNRNRAILGIGLFGTLWAASSGAQAIRIALNRAYGVRHGLPFWKARIKVIILTAIGTAATLLVFGAVIVLPHLWTVLDRTVGAAEGAWLRPGIRYGTAFAVLVLVYALFYRFLPDLPPRLRTVFPGAILGATLWLASAAVFSWTLSNLGKLILIYGGFAGAVATLVFLYVNAAVLIFGAEINAVLARRDDGAST